MIKKLGFTLAEVLITLGIIGVIAAITMPTLINNSNKAVAVTALKRAYAILSQAQEMIAADSGDFQSALSGVQTSEDFGNVFISKMKVSKNCKMPDTHGECFPNDLRPLNNTGNFTMNDFLSIPSLGIVDSKSNDVITTDGISYAFALIDPNCKGHDEELGYILCGAALVDVNGIKKNPSIVGREIFAFVMTKDKVLPAGTGFTQDDLNAACNPNDLTNGDGFNCAAKVLSDGAMNY